MATITDILQTQLRLVGINAFVQGMNAAGAATSGLGAGLGAVTKALGPVGIGIAVVVGEIGILTAIASRSVQQFSDYETQLLRTALVFRNMGDSIPIAELQQYAAARQALTGIDEKATLALESQLRFYGLSIQQIKGLIPVLQDVQAAGRGSAEETASAINRYLRTGRTRGLVPLGVNVQLLTGNVDNDLREIERQLKGRVGGVSEELANSLGGSINRVAKQLDTLFRRIGDLIGPLVTTVANYINSVIQTWINGLDVLIYLLNLLPTPFKTATGHDQETLNTRRTTEGFGDRDSQNLDEIRQNTGKAANALVAAVLGGAGTVARQTGSFRNLNAAIRVGR